MITLYATDLKLLSEHTELTNVDIYILLLKILTYLSTNAGTDIINIETSIINAETDITNTETDINSTHKEHA